jgi:hypothetical protein
MSINGFNLKKASKFWRLKKGWSPEKDHPDRVSLYHEFENLRFFSFKAQNIGSRTRIITN